jgi:NADPH:quinone reductase
VIRVTRSAVIDAPIERVWAVLRDFNSHDAWHPVVAESSIEHGEPSDQVGCVRSFTLKDGHHIREQLLTLSDRDHVSTYCILDATLPMRRYVATVRLKRITDGDRTFWHWQSTFDAPAGREREFADLVGKGVYEGGFEGLRAYLRRGARSAAVAGPTISARETSSRGTVPPTSCYRPRSMRVPPALVKSASARQRSASTTSTFTFAPAAIRC